MRSNVAVPIVIIASFIVVGGIAVYHEIQVELEKKENELYHYSFINQKTCLEEYDGMYNMVTEECVTKDPIKPKQTYTGHTSSLYFCEPKTIGNVIIKENCDKVLKWMEMDELIQFIQDNPDALTDEEQNILISKAVGNMYPDMVDHEVENKANVIMWNLIEEGLY